MGRYKFAVAVSLLCGFTACTDDQATRSLVILQNASATGTDGVCLGSGTEAANALTTGTIDLNGADGLYLMFPVVRSVIEADGGASLADVNRRTVFLEGYDVNVDFGELGGDATSFTGALSAFIAPGDTSSVPVTATSPVLVDELRARVPAGEEALIFLSVELFGTLAGSPVRSSELRFPVRVCTNCLVQNIGACSDVDEMGAAGHPCGLVQDVLLQCCENSLGDTICPAEPEELE